MKKKYFLIIGILIIVGGLLFIGYQINEQRKEEARMAEEIAESYRRLHYAIGALRYNGSWTDGWRYGRLELLEQYSSYHPLDRVGFSSRKNDHGIFEQEYLILRMYYHRGGVYLSYEMLVDYFSEEFEPDGTLRLYNNGKHPEIEAFVTWMWEGLRGLGSTQIAGEFEEYEESLHNIRRAYIDVNSSERRGLPVIGRMSPQMLDAVARAEADPDYELDLTSLQEQGY